MEGGREGVGRMGAGVTGGGGRKEVTNGCGLVLDAVGITACIAY